MLSQDREDPIHEGSFWAYRRLYRGTQESSLDRYGVERESSYQKDSLEWFFLGNTTLPAKGQVKMSSQRHKGKTHSLGLS